MARPSVNFTVIPVKSTNGRQRSLVDVPREIQGDARPFLRPVEITYTAAHRKWYLRNQFPKFNGVIWADVGDSAATAGLPVMS
jgi:hypothetical protein